MADSNPVDTPIEVMSAVPSGIQSAADSVVGTPQSLPPMDNEERIKSINVTLADMVAKATALYQYKKYEEAAEIFSSACERQAELNEEMNPENAEILFLYGRCLFKIGQSNSDVLGGKAPEKKSKPKKSQAKSSTTNAHAEEKAEVEKLTEEGVAALAEKVGAEEEKEALEAKKPLFQFNGDENFEDSDEEGEADGEGQEEEEEEEEEEDDLAVAFEILELSRVGFEAKLESYKTTTPGVYDPEHLKEVRHIQERLSEIHDLLAEISLENEKFPEAIKDGRQSLFYKKELYPEESEIIAEAHYKLSLALEFASMTTTDEEGAEGGSKNIDEEMRKEAGDELEKAIKSTQLKLQGKELELATVHAPDENDETRRQITEVKEIIADMEQRLTDLRKPPVDINEALGQENPLSGLLGNALGDSSLQEAKKNAKDLTGLVRKKAKAEPQPEPVVSNGKRKAEEPVEGQEETKKAKVEVETPATQS